MISERRPHKITSYSVLCKRNTVFFLQHLVVAKDHSELPAPDRSVLMRLTAPLNRYCRHLSLTVAAIMMFGSVASIAAERTACEPGEVDRVWMISTRGLTNHACSADLSDPALQVYRVERCGQLHASTIDEYLSSIGPERPVAIYVHGNRMPAEDAAGHGLVIYRQCKGCLRGSPIDWVIWSWPSEQTGILAHDIRIKAARTDLQGLYLAWLLREHVERSAGGTLIGFSFGGRIATGALHALAGGVLGNRQLGGAEVTGPYFRAGLLAPAIDRNWLSSHGYHSGATKNLDRMVLLYNRRDIVLKRYWLIDKVRGRMALGYTGPTMFGLRADGSPLPVQARDCSASIGFKHVELEYYGTECCAGASLATLIDDPQVKTQVSL